MTDWSRLPSMFAMDAMTPFSEKIEQLEKDLAKASRLGLRTDEAKIKAQLDKAYQDEKVYLASKKT